MELVGSNNSLGSRLWVGTNAQIGATVHPRFRGRVVLVARTLWLAFILTSLVFFWLTIPARYMNLHDEALLAAGGLDQLHLDPGFLPGFIMTFDALTLAVYLLVGILIFWRKSSEWISFFTSICLIINAPLIVRPMDALFFITPGLRIPFLILFALGITCVYVLVYLFPDGRFLPRWTIWMLLISVAYLLGTYLVPALAGSALRWPEPISPIVFTPILMGAAVQIYRYRRWSTDRQREQTKWIVYGMAAVAVGLPCYRWLVPAFRPEVLQPGLDRLIYDMVGIPLVYVTLILFPVTIAISIFWHRLWDIDLLISRTLVYGSLTAILAGVYTACITLFQKLFVAMTGQQSDAAVVLSTLIIVAGFTPLKEQLQGRIDKGRKETSDAERKLHALAEQVQSRIFLVDPQHLTYFLLKEAVAGYNAKGGAVFWGQNGTQKIIHSLGEWGGEAQASADLVCRAGPRRGVLMVGPRRNGAAYTKRDLELLRDTVSLVMEAIETDGQATDLPDRYEE